MNRAKTLKPAHLLHHIFITRNFAIIITSVTNKSKFMLARLLEVFTAYQQQDASSGTSHLMSSLLAFERATSYIADLDSLW